MSYNQALQVIKRNGGVVDDKKAVIKIQMPKPVPLEIGFAGHYPIENKELNLTLTNEASFEFEGIGIAVNGAAASKDKSKIVDYTFKVEMHIDGNLVETVNLPTDYRTRKFVPFYKYQLPAGKHNIRLKVMNPTNEAEILLPNAIVYGDKPL
jgi:hypothetical protein